MCSVQWFFYSFIIFLSYASICNLGGGDSLAVERLQIFRVYETVVNQVLEDVFLLFTVFLVKLVQTLLEIDFIGLQNISYLVELHIQPFNYGNLLLVLVLKLLFVDICVKQDSEESAQACSGSLQRLNLIELELFYIFRIKFYYRSLKLSDVSLYELVFLFQTIQVVLYRSQIDSQLTQFLIYVVKLLLVVGIRVVLFLAFKLIFPEL